MTKNKIYDLCVLEIIIKVLGHSFRYVYNLLVFFDNVYVNFTITRIKILNH